MDNFVKWFKKTFLVVMPKERTRKNVHLLTNDAQSLLQELLPEQSSWGVFDPFDTIYEIIYQLTIRMVGPTEIAQDAKLRAKSLSILESIEHSKSTMRVVFPWLPTIMHLRRTLRNIQLGMLLHGLIRKRQKSGIREDDTMQILLDMGTSMRNTIGVGETSLLIFNHFSLHRLRLAVRHRGIVCRPAEHWHQRRLGTSQVSGERAMDGSGPYGS